MFGKGLIEYIEVLCLYSLYCTECSETRYYHILVYIWLFLSDFAIYWHVMEYIDIYSVFWNIKE